MTPLKMNKYFQQVSASTSIPWNTSQKWLLKGADACQLMEYCYEYFSAVMFKDFKETPFNIDVWCYNILFNRLKRKPTTHQFLVPYSKELLYSLYNSDMKTYHKP